MLLRKDGPGVIAIPQPSHAWLSGQLARAWGNERFAEPDPHEDLCLAAEQHDIGWHSWEMAPALDLETGLPQEFSKVPSKAHIALWRDGVRRATSFWCYPALLVSLHADTIYARYFDFNKATQEDAEAVREFLEEQHRFQTRITASLHASPEVGVQASPDHIKHNQALVAALDWMSLEICWGVTREKKIPGVPVVWGSTEAISLCPRGGLDLIADPWPFREAYLEVKAEGNRLRGRFKTQAELQRALDEAEPVFVTAVLHRA